jgi:hypothetical protein
MTIVPLDGVRSMSMRDYFMLTASIYWRRLRKKLPMHFRCDCGWRYKNTRFDHEHWNQILTITCYECGDIYRTFQNTIVSITPNPFSRCLISDRARGGIDDRHPFASIARQRANSALRRGTVIKSKHAVIKSKHA